MRSSLAAKGRLLVAAVLWAAVAVSGQEFTRTQISDTLFNADGSRAVGSLRISWKSFTGTDGSTVAKNSVDLDIVDGIVSVALAPNLGAVPDGTYYSVEYRLHKGERSNELWIVPDSVEAVSIADIRVLSVPTVGMSVSLGQVNGLPAALDGKADKAATNTFLAPQVLREDAPGTGNPLLGLQKNDGAAGVFFRLPELSGDITYTLPPDAGSANQSLTTDGGGALFWASAAGGGSGESITVNASAVDTIANLDDTSTIAWALVDGGGGGPDDVQASIVANSIGPEQIDETATYDFSGGGMTLPSGVAIGYGTTPFNLTGYTDDATPSAPGATNQFTMYVDRSSGALSVILNGGSAVAYEEDTHASEHAEDAADELLVEDLGTACAAGETAVSDGSGGLDCGSTVTGGGTANYVPIYDGTQSLTSGPLFLSGNYLGLGTVTPSFANGSPTTGNTLTVSNNGYLQARFVSTTTAGGFMLENQLGKKWEFQSAAPGFTVYNRSENKWSFIILNSTGYTGIGGVPTPTAPLEVGTYSGVSLFTVGNGQTSRCWDQTPTTGDSLCAFRGGAGETGYVLSTVTNAGATTGGITAAGAATFTSVTYGATGAVNWGASATEPVDCTTANDGSTYFDTTDARPCVCINDGTDDEWVILGDYSHATGHCSI